MQCTKCGHPIPTPTDMNHCILSGVIVSVPTIVPIKNNKRLCLFSLKTDEKFETADRRKGVHTNVFKIEVLGKNIDRAIDTLFRGDRCVVNGYLRADDIDGVEVIRVRAFSFQKE